jgi:hypothetical protein
VTNNPGKTLLAASLLAAVVFAAPTIGAYAATGAQAAYAAAAQGAQGAYAAAAQGAQGAYAYAAEGAALIGQRAQEISAAVTATLAGLPARAQLLRAEYDFANLPNGQLDGTIVARWRPRLLALQSQSALSASEEALKTFLEGKLSPSWGSVLGLDNVTSALGWLADRVVDPFGAGRRGGARATVCRAPRSALAHWPGRNRLPQRPGPFGPAPRTRS